MATQLANLQLRVAKAPQAAFQLTDVAAANVFLSGVTGITEARSLLDSIQADLKTGAASPITVKGVFTLEARLGADGATPIFTVIPAEGKGIQLSNLLKAGSAQMSKLSEADRSSVPTRNIKRKEKGRDIEL
ncbi:hypothetical protein [Tunturiibacter psychrotolerans]|uniref:hypothetical protein n=1 Tax=Tunturiibacter psychrotolerans TaxID=3069686 RepID=UPI003D1B04C0